MVSLQSPALSLLDPSVHHDFTTPTKCINEGQDVNSFLSSKAYGDILTWILQLNGAMFPRKPTADSDSSTAEMWLLGAVELSAGTQRLAGIMSKLDSAVDEVPPDPGPRRFGNVAFRKWIRLVEQRADSLLDEALSGCSTLIATAEAKAELRAYLLGSFGSAERLDYGSGHELSYLAFLGGMWKVGGFGTSQNGSEERSIVLGVLSKYLDLTRKLIKVYNLEPAGSHGVWGLDDHFFIPYILGSAQYAPAIANVSQIPSEGSLTNAPNPADIMKIDVVNKERRTNLYFGAVGFIYDVKKGPFWEHSPVLFDISGVKGGWAKINKGMIKMYNAEVLSKFPVVQHFPFGYLFKWEQDPNAASAVATAHTASQPKKAKIPGLNNSPSTRAPVLLNPAPAGFVGTAAPWARAPSAKDPLSLPTTTALPRAENSTTARSVPVRFSNRTTRVADAATSPHATNTVPTRAPWSKE